jgi:monofunctional biosynthetic peptidoglycan transglycosylase
MIYGIGEGAHYYFGKPASALSPRECAFLAAMLPGPRVAYNPYKNLSKVLKRSEMILRLLRGRGVLSEDEYRTAMAEMPNISGLQKKVDTSIVKAELPANMSTARLPEPAAGVPAQPEPAAATPTGAASAAPQAVPPPAGDGNVAPAEKPGEGRKQ